jgi:integrase
MSLILKICCPKGVLVRSRPGAPNSDLTQSVDVQIALNLLGYLLLRCPIPSIKECWYPATMLVYMLVRLANVAGCYHGYQHMPLTDVQVRNLKAKRKPAKYSDGGGLHLLVPPQGSKLWRLAYRFGGKQKTLAFGAYPAVSLWDARTKRDAAKKLLASGIDPSHHAKVEKTAAAERHGNTFSAVADEFLKKVQREGKSEATLGKKRWLLSLAMPDIGRRPIAEITAAEILVPLRRVEAEGNYETARRLRATIGQIFRYAIAVSKASNDPTFGLRGALVTPKVTHRASITDKGKFGALLRAIWTYDGTVETRAALKLMALLFPRPGELRFAEWSEFDFDKAIWIIPAARMKMRREHRKPLSAPAIDVLDDLKRHTGNRRLAFPSVRSPQRPISENTLNAALRRLGYTTGEATAHGFRSSASSLLNESGKWQVDAIEAELAHVGADEVRRAYNRSAYWDERVKMAEWWGEEVLRLRDGLETFQGR